MAQSVSNDALWEKLSEIEEKMEKSLMEQKAPVQAQEQDNIPSEIKAVKKEILAEIEVKANLLGTHSQSHFDANRQNIIALGENIRKILSLVRHIRKDQKGTIEQEYIVKSL